MTVLDLSDPARSYAAAGWRIFPVHTPTVDGGCSCGNRATCTPGKHPRTKHGLTTATTDEDVVSAWWERWPDANIGAVVPDGLFVVDEDPRNGGSESLAELEADHEPLPETLTCITGGGGTHRYFNHPGGSILAGAHKLGRGLDLKLPRTGYLLMPPSLHMSGNRYRWQAALVPPADVPEWLLDLLKPPTPQGLGPLRTPRRQGGSRVADTFCESTTWAEILEPHGWVMVGQRGDICNWRRPGKNVGISATTRCDLGDCLFVFSSSTLFDVTEPGHPRGYTKFRAFAELNFGAHMSAATRYLRSVAP